MRSSATFQLVALLSCLMVAAGAREANLAADTPTETTGDGTYRRSTQDLPLKDQKVAWSWSHGVEPTQEAARGCLQPEYSHPSRLEAFSGEDRPTKDHDHDQLPRARLNPTKTYERIVLEGTDVRVGCPHMSATQLANSFTPGDHSRRNKREQSTHERGHNERPVPQYSPPTDARADEQPNSKRVRWFRNHVPLVNLNDFAQNQNFSSSYGGPKQTFGRQLKSETITTTELETTELSQLLGGDGEASIENRAEPKGTWPMLSESSTYSYVASTSERGALTSGDGNEPRDKRRLFNLVSANPDPGGQRHINEFGELVIYKVSQYFAGRYTCLADGRQSEVLIDILPSRDTAEIVGQERQNPLRRGRDPRGAEGISTASAGPTTSFRGPAAAQSEINQLMGSISQVKQDLVPTRSSGQAKTSVPDGSRSSEIFTTVGSGHKLGAAGIADRQSRLMRNRRPTRAITGHRAQHTQVHLIDSETIRAEDLKLIPGFLYTRQQLYCPVPSSGAALGVDHLVSLSRTLCPISSNSTAAEGDRETCVDLARRLILWLITSRRSHACADWPLELVWFKDGTRLEFDSSSGRVSNSGLDIKLTDSSGTNPEKVGYTRNRVRREYKAAELSAGSPPTKNELCSHGDRILVIDGVQRDGAGYYTCALRLSITKLKKIIQGLHEQIDPKENFFEPIGSRSRRSGQETDRKSYTEARDGTRDQVADSNWSRIRPIQTIEFVPNRSYPSNESPSNSDSKDLPDDKTAITERIKLMESMLADGFATKESLGFLERLLVGMDDPLATIQTFSLAVANRAADSCNLWSTVQEADAAYTSRRLADFRRLKGARDHERSPQPSPRPLAVGGEPSRGSAQSELDAERQTLIKNSDANDDTSGPNANERRGLDSSFSGQHVNGDNQAAGWGSGARDLRARLRRRRQTDGRDASTAMIARDNNGPGHARKPPPNYVDEQSNRSSGAESPIDSGTSSGASSQTGLLGRSAPFNYVNEPNLELSGAERQLARNSNDHLARSAWGRPDPTSKIDDQAARHAFGAAATQSGETKGHKWYYHKLHGDRGAANIVVPNGEESPRAGLAPSLTIGTPAAPDHRPPLVLMDVAHRAVDRVGALSVIDGDLDRQRVAEGSELLAGPKMSPSTGHELRVVSPSLPRPIKSDATNGWRTEPTGALPRDSVTSIKSAARDIAADGHKTDRFHYDPWPAHKLTLLKTNRLDRAGAATDAAIGTEAADKSRADSDNRDGIGAGHSADKLPSRKQRQMASTGQVRGRNADDSSEGGSPSAANELRATAPQGSGYQYEHSDSSADARTRHSRSISSSELTVAATLGMDNTGDRDLKVPTDDESILWTAGQYVYMHMRAVAASSIYGVQVDVEWSNERINSSDTELNRDVATRPETSGSKMDDADGNSYNSYLRNRDAAPFAVVDVISGQNLYLQCTAQAFGRLPEIAWYKRIDSLPQRLWAHSNKTRRIGNNLYWPLAEIDAITNDDNNSVVESMPFVCSQSTTIFDNLVNQTFTVIQRLDLSQYNDSSDIKEDPRSPGANLNLYACIVDADVRHNYATLGVHFRRAPSRIPPDVSKRLEAQSAFFHLESNLGSKNFVPIHPDVDNLANYNLLRDSRYEPTVPMDWISLQNKSLLSEEFALNTTHLTPTMLSIIIVFVFSSLLALVYLTLRSYQSLTHFQTENDLDDAYPSIPSDDSTGGFSGVSRTQVLLHELTGSGCNVMTQTIHNGCSCLLGSQAVQLEFADAGAIELPNACSQFEQSLDVVETDIYLANNQAKVLHEAYARSEHQPMYTDITTAHIPEHPSIVDSVSTPRKPSTGVFNGQAERYRHENLPAFYCSSEYLFNEPTKHVTHMIQNPVEQECPLDSNRYIDTKIIGGSSSSVEGTPTEV